MGRQFHKLFVAIGTALLAVPAFTTDVTANWLTALTKGASKTARHLDSELGAVGRAARHLHDLPEGGKGALAAHVTPEGHWQFANKEGQFFTAGTPDELKRVVPTLMPEGIPGDGKLSLYLSEESVFAEAGHLDKLPNAELHLVTPHGAFPLARGGAGRLKVRFRPNVVIEASEQRLLDETLSTLARPLNKSNIRTLSITPGAGKSMSSAPRIDSATKLPLVDEIDPAQLSQSLGAIRGQTALLVGRVDNGKIIFQPAKGAEVSHDLAALHEAAAKNDVNLVLLHADVPRQPGGRNWLWQITEVGGLEASAAKSTVGDFLDALGGRRGAPMLLNASDSGLGRVRLSAAQESGGSLAETAGSTLEELVAHVTGEAITKAAEITVRDQSQQSELDGRFIPGIPTYVQIPYFAGIVMGILGWTVSRSWWKRIWPAGVRRTEDGRLAHMLRATPNFLVYLLAFLPVAGGPAFIWQLLLQAWATATAPFRWLAKIFRRKVEV